MLPPAVSIRRPACPIEVIRTGTTLRSLAWALSGPSVTPSKRSIRPTRPTPLAAPAAQVRPAMAPSQHPTLVDPVHVRADQHILKRAGARVDHYLTTSAKPSRPSTATYHDIATGVLASSLAKPAPRLHQPRLPRSTPVDPRPGRSGDQPAAAAVGPDWDHSSSPVHHPCGPEKQGDHDRRRDPRRPQCRAEGRVGGLRVRSPIRTSPGLGAAGCLRAAAARRGGPTRPVHGPL